MEKPVEEEKKNKPKLNIAVFFDAENITAKFVQSVYNIVRQEYNIVILRAYADWSLPTRYCSPMTLAYFSANAAIDLRFLVAEDFTSTERNFHRNWKLRFAGLHSR